MKVGDIRKALHRKPWRPVEFILDSGDHVIVQHIEDIAVSFDDSRLFLYPDGQEIITTPDKVTAVRRVRK